MCDIQAQLNRLRASLDPANAKPLTPANPYMPPPPPQGMMPGLQQAPFYAPTAQFVAPDSTSLWCILKRYAKYWVLAAVVMGLGFLYMKRSKQLSGPKRPLPPPSIRVPENIDSMPQVNRQPQPVFRNQPPPQPPQEPTRPVDPNFTTL
jgi:hypothetical protein